ncbi:MAG TPA: MFS transporter [Pirellulales bacterium]|nr:MFS transporter [Pirellulales bacterium]
MHRPQHDAAPTESDPTNPYESPVADQVTLAEATAGIPPVVKSHPIGFWFFFWGELAERCSYYGMRAILTLYLIDQLGLTRPSAIKIMHFFMAGCYLLPLAGGYIADRFLGKYWTIVGFSLPYIVGQAILGVENKIVLGISLSLLAMGSGVIKPNISTLMGLTYDQQRPGQEKLRSDAFAMFYFAINLGAALSSFAMPRIRSEWNYQVAFLFPAGLMAVAFLIFAAGKRFYAVEQVGVGAKNPSDRAEQKAVLRRLMGIFGVVIFFWSIFDQSASTWTLFANDHLNLEMFGVKFNPDELQAFNPLLIIVLLPPVTLFWKFLAARGLELRPTDKMMVGFLLTTLTMGIMSAAGFLTSPEHKVSALWEIAAYVVITIAEICISVVGLELAFTAAPKNMKSFVTACWLVTVFIANLLDMAIAPLYGMMSPGAYFGLLTALMLAITAAFWGVARKFNRAAAAP